LLGVVSPPVQALACGLALGAALAFAQSGLGRGDRVREEPRHGSLRPDGTALLIGGLAALCFASEGSVLDWSSLYLRVELGAATTLSGAAFAAFSGTMALGRFLGDRLRRRFGATLVVRAGALLAVLGLIAGPLSGSAIAATAGFALTGLGLSN